MFEIVSVFRALLGLTVAAGLLIIVAASISIGADQDVFTGILFGVSASAGLILTVGIAAAIVLATDYLREIRDELRASANISVPTSPGATSSRSPRSVEYRLQGSTSGRTKIKTYKGHKIERDGEGKIWVDGQTFEGLLAAERYIRDR